MELCPSKQAALILGDTAIRRYGPKVQGAPAASQSRSCSRRRGFWVWTLVDNVGLGGANAALGRDGHPPGQQALPEVILSQGSNPGRRPPLGSKLYVRQQDIEKLPPDWRFPTKPQLGLELALEVVELLKQKGLKVVLVQDGAWTHRQYIVELRKAGLVVVVGFGRTRSCMICRRLGRSTFGCLSPQNNNLPIYGKAVSSRLLISSNLLRSLKVAFYLHFPDYQMELAPPKIPSWMRC